MHAGFGPVSTSSTSPQARATPPIPAAEAGAIVTASDLTPELFDAGRRIAAQRGVELEWVEADAEALPFADDSYDIVMSAVGVMFAPHHQAAADELIRVCRPGGTIGLINWTPQGFIGNLFATMKPYAPPLPPGASPAPLWGNEDHVRELFGDRVTGLEMRRQKVVIDHSPTPEEFREYWKRNYGPTISVYKFNADQPDRVAALDRDFLSFLTEWNQSTEPGGPPTTPSTCSSLRRRAVISRTTAVIQPLATGGWITLSTVEKPVKQLLVERASSALADVDTAGWTLRFDLLSDPNRLEILLCLHRAPGICVGDLAEALGRSENAVSQALRVLRQQGWVSSTRAGREVSYRLEDEIVHELLHRIGAQHG